MKVPNPAGEDDRRREGEETGDSSMARQPTRAANLAPVARDSSAPTARTVADGAIAAWKATADALVPLIGQSAVTVLYRRCLVSVGRHRTWLPAVSAADLPENDWAGLHASVCRQTSKEASEACVSLFVAFQDLLGSLIGPSLTEQLLRPVAALPSTGSAVQDNLP